MAWVLKIGGSLYRHPELRKIVQRAGEFAENPLIIPK